jgi:hypothetical protein
VRRSLKVVLDDALFAKGRVVGIESRGTPSTSLTKKVIALIELHFDVLESGQLLNFERCTVVGLFEFLLFGRKFLDLVKYCLVVHGQAFPHRVSFSLHITSRPISSVVGKSGTITAVAFSPPREYSSRHIPS